jgi:hypothetical protein
MKNVQKFNNCKQKLAEALQSMHKIEFHTNTSSFIYSFIIT